MYDEKNKRKKRNKNLIGETPFTTGFFVVLPRKALNCKYDKWNETFLDQSVQEEH